MSYDAEAVYREALDRRRPAYTSAQRVARHLKSKYRMEVEEYDALYDRQGGGCAICGKPEARYTLAVDHDHRTGKVRGLLCGLCNSGIGLFRDDARLMEQGIIYLVSTETVEN